MTTYKIQFYDVVRKQWRDCARRPESESLNEAQKTIDAARKNAGEMNDPCDYRIVAFTILSY